MMYSGHTFVLSLSDDDADDDDADGDDDDGDGDNATLAPVSDETAFVTSGVFSSQSTTNAADDLVLLAYYNSPSVRVDASLVAGDPSPSFAPTTQQMLKSFDATAATQADVDNNGFMDVILLVMSEEGFGHDVPYSIIVLFNTNGIFSNSNPSPPGTCALGFSGDLLAADVNGDGWVDAVSTCRGSVFVFLGSGPDAFVDAPVALNFDVTSPPVFSFVPGLSDPQSLDLLVSFPKLSTDPGVQWYVWDRLGNAGWNLVTSHLPHRSSHNTFAPVVRVSDAPPSAAAVVDIVVSSWPFSAVLYPNPSSVSSINSPWPEVMLPNSTGCNHFVYVRASEWYGKKEPASDHLLLLAFCRTESGSAFSLWRGSPDASAFAVDSTFPLFDTNSDVDQLLVEDMTGTGVVDVAIVYGGIVSIFHAPGNREGGLVLEWYHAITAFNFVLLGNFDGIGGSDMLGVYGPSYNHGLELFVMANSYFSRQGSPSQTITYPPSSTVRTCRSLNSVVCLSHAITSTSRCTRDTLDLGARQFTACPYHGPIPVTTEISLVGGTIDCASSTWYSLGHNGVLFSVEEGGRLDMWGTQVLRASYAPESPIGSSPIRVSGPGAFLGLHSVSVSHCSTVPPRSGGSSAGGVFSQMARLFAGLGGVVAATDGAKVVVENSVFTHNSAGQGGGVFLVVGEGTVVEVTNSTFTHNSVANGGGGVVLSLGMGRMTCVQCGFVKNTARFGGVVASFDDRVSNALVSLFPTSPATLPLTFAPGSNASVSLDGFSLVDNKGDYGGFAFVCGSKISIQNLEDGSRGTYASTAGGAAYACGLHIPVAPFMTAHDIFIFGAGATEAALEASLDPDRMPGYGTVYATPPVRAEWATGNDGNNTRPRVPSGLSLGPDAVVTVWDDFGQVVIDLDVAVEISMDTSHPWPTAGSSPRQVLGSSFVDFSALGVSAPAPDDLGTTLALYANVVDSTEGIATLPPLLVTITGCAPSVLPKVTNTSGVMCSCPPNALPSAAGPSACKCTVDHWAPPGSPGTCPLCPEGATCEGGSELPIASPGWYPSSTVGVFVPCPSEGACTGGEELCEEGRTGRVCGACEKGWYARQGECAKCRSSESGAQMGFAGVLMGVAGLVGIFVCRRGVVKEDGADSVQHGGHEGSVSHMSVVGWVLEMWRLIAASVLEICVVLLLAVYGLAETWELIVLSLVLVATMVALVAVRIRGRGARVVIVHRVQEDIEAVLKSFLVFLQTAGAILSLSPSTLTSFHLVRTLFGVVEQASVSLNGLGCVGLGTEQKLYVLLGLLPGLVCVALLAFGIGALLFGRGEFRALQARVRMVIVTATFVLFFPLVQWCLSAMSCIDSGVPGDSTRYLNAYPWIRCGGVVQARMATAGSCCLFALVGVVGAVAWRARREAGGGGHHHSGGVVDGMREPLLEGGGHDDGEEDEWVAFLYEMYVPQVWWFEAVVMGRRVMLAFALAFIPEGSPLAPLVVSTILIGATGTQVVFKPFKTSVVNVLEVTSLVGCLILLRIVSSLEQLEEERSVGFARGRGESDAMIGMMVVGLGFVTCLYVGSLARPILSLVRRQ